MRLLHRLGIVSAKARELKGAVVLSFDCRGCMASDHQLEYVARCETVVHDDGHQCGPWVRAKIIKRDHLESRDHDLGHVQLHVDNTALQQIGPGLFFLYH